MPGRCTGLARAAAPLLFVHRSHLGLVAGLHGKEKRQAAI